LAVVTLDRWGIWASTKDKISMIKSMSDEEIVRYAEQHYADDEAISLFLRYYHDGSKRKITKKILGGRKTVIYEIPPHSPHWIRLMRERIIILEKGILWRGEA